MSACQYCLPSGPHRHHKVLKIYRHVYKDVVSLSAMEKYIDTSQIQPYKCNKRLVISLNPLPHCGSAIKNEASCNTCNRKLSDPDSYRYCSITCKVKAVVSKPNESDPPFITIPSSPPPPPPPPSPQGTSEPQNLRKRKRKGIPHRAPFL
ncbi:hypothetical protein Fmac_031165 [Flemingia macrophylla]|uniref:PLATZ transcription factor family protein n=1 Tax=Flemingia macrophylla TaxID=520843 RepID=A0ABD1L1B0_9FABA